ncbi:hypothetical protein [Agarivorans sp. Alg241-V36]|uniref:hypothetical protein n=1 Tax=Agarivorans sp. Alg241-V36 TaxID=2305992 RepID=UPI0013D21E9D|nr:hypothetical protein [Agarivorans sp. Alg241-V36]
MDNESYLVFCKAELRSVFENTKAGKPDDKLKYRVEGLFHAAKLLGILSTEQASAIIESEHQAVFGESVSERLKRKTQLKQLKESDLEAYFNIPTIERL